MTQLSYIFRYSSPLGPMTLASNGDALTGLWFDGQDHFGVDLAAECIEKELPVFEQTISWLDIYFSGTAPGFVPPLNLSASHFRRRVWEILLTIPFGETMTYGQIARIVAEKNGLRRMSAQAVGGAVGYNPVSLIIPCHRVIGSDGSLTGYAGGLERKKWLLRMEKTASKNGTIASELSRERTGCEENFDRNLFSCKLLEYHIITT